MLSAQASDPRVLGWMQGFPPPPDKRIGQPDSDYFRFPKLRWSVCHLRELLPTEQVSRGLGAPVPLEVALDDGIDAVSFTPLGSDAPMTWEDSLSANYTDGILILHRGRVVYERYFGALDEAGQHAAMSMTKSLTGLLAEILIAEGGARRRRAPLEHPPRAGDERLRQRHGPSGDGHDHGARVPRGLRGPAAAMVIVRFASFPSASNSAGKGQILFDAVVAGASWARGERP